MATIDRYKLVVDVDGQQSVDKLKNSISSLGTVIGGISFAAFTKGVLAMADAMNDLADATGLAIKDIAAFDSAVMLAGGNSEASGKMIASFYQQIDKAAQGSEQAQKALERVGISFADLGALSEKDLLSKAVKGLAEMPAGAERTAAGMELLGKAFRNIDPKTLEQIMQAGTDVNTEAIEKMAKAADNMAYNFKQLQLAGANVFAGIMTAVEPFIGKLEDGRLKVEQAEKAIKLIGAAIAVVFGVQAVAMIGGFVTSILNLNKALMGTALVTNLLGKNPLIKIIGGLAVAAGIGAVAWDQYEKALKDVEKANKDVADSTPGAAPAPQGPARATQFYSDEELKARKTAAETAKQQTISLQQQNAEALKYQQIVNATIGMENNRASLIQSNAQAEQDRANKVRDLEKQIEVERSKGRGTNQAVITQLQAQIVEVNKQKDAQVQLNQEKYKALEAQRQMTMDLNRMATEQTRQIEVDLIKQQIEGMSAVTIQEQTALKAAQLTAEEKKRIVELQKELAMAQAQGDQLAINDINQRMNMERQYYATLRDLENKRMEQEIANRDNRELGIKRALENIERNFDPVKVAADQTTLLFDRMGQGLEEFVKTGKLNFKDFALSLIRDLLLIQIKAQAMKWLSGAMGGGGLFGGAIIPGILGEGGPVTPGKPYIVGDKGPELFVPKSAGTVLPNDMVAGKRGVASGAVNAPVTNNYITNNVSAIDAQSVAQFFAQNRRLMLGSVEMARKEMPYGSGR